MPGQTAGRIGDLISIAPAPAVISLSDLEGLRDRLDGGVEARDELGALVASYSLESRETRAAFDAMAASLGRKEQRGDAFLIQGVYGAGKSHLLALLALLCGHGEEAWPAFLDTHPSCERPDFGWPRLVVAVALDEYSARTHTLEGIVLSRIEAELAKRHGLQVALSDDSHLLDLVDRYVAPQAGEPLDAGAKEAHGRLWRELRAAAPAEAAEVALAFLKEARFPLDWRRSRAEAWGKLRGALQEGGIDGPVILLDELGTFLAGKDRQGLNADASFLQYLAQRSANDRSWLICVTQRGLEEVGDIDRRTLRQLRDRFRPGFMLDLSELGWVVERRLVKRRDGRAFGEVARRLHAAYCEAAGEPPFSAAELARCYPLNPLCLEAVQRGAESCLSRTRSAIRLLQESLVERRWLGLPADRLITPDVAFDIFRSEMALSALGQRHLRAYEVVTANAGRIAPGREGQLGVVMKALCLLGLGELRWSEGRLRTGLVGCVEPEVWREPEVLRELLQALSRRGAYVERRRGEAGEADEYYVDVASDVSERMRRRLSELTAALGPEDGRVAQAALGACRGVAFPLASLAEPRSIGVVWANARRFVSIVCCDLRLMSGAELGNLAAELGAAHVREDARLFLAPPTSDQTKQEAGWREVGADVEGRFAGGLLAWLPRQLTEAERAHLVDYAGLASMVADRTLVRRRDREFRDRLRRRWAECEEEVRHMLQRAYYDGRIIGADGEEVVEPERLSTLFGDWGETLTAIFSTAFRRLFPRFESIAPGRRLAGRAQTNQIVDQFIRCGKADLPPASTLEAHLIAYAAPLGLVEGEERRPRLALRNRELAESAVAAAPARSGGGELDPKEAIQYAELAGRLAKSEWGLTREQSELLVAALIRTGHLVALDAFLQPVRLDAVAAPLGDNLPYVMRGEGLRGAAAEQAKAIWEAVSGEAVARWDLPAQERAWGDMIGWAARVSTGLEEARAAIARAAESFGHGRQDWAWAEEGLGRAAAIAGRVEESLDSRDGLARVASAAARMPGGVEKAAESLAAWRECGRFFGRYLEGLAEMHRLLTDERMHLPKDSLLVREHRSLLDRFGSVRAMVSGPESVRSAGRRWLENYRRHYLAWHSRVHGAARFEGVAALQRSAEAKALKRLSGVGVGKEEAARIEGELARAVGRRCLASDPLPEGCAVCPSCGLGLGKEVERAEAGELGKRVAAILGEQVSELVGREELLKRRLEGCREEGVRGAVERLLAGAEGFAAEELNGLLSDQTISWLKRQLAQPRARRRELGALQEALRGKEMTKQEVRRIVEEWLGPGEDEVVEIA